MNPILRANCESFFWNFLLQRPFWTDPKLYISQQIFSLFVFLELQFISCQFFVFRKMYLCRILTGLPLGCFLSGLVHLLAVFYQASFFHFFPYTVEEKN